MEEHRHVAVQRSGARDAEYQPPAERLADLVEHELVGQRVLRRQPGPDRETFLLAPADLEADGQRAVEDRLLEAAGLLGRGAYAVVDLVVDPWNAGHEVGADLLEVFGDRRHVLSERQRQRLAHAQVRDQAREHVSQRQEQQRLEVRLGVDHLSG